APSTGMVSAASRLETAHTVHRVNPLRTEGALVRGGIFRFGTGGPPRGAGGPPSSAVESAAWRRRTPGGGRGPTFGCLNPLLSGPDSRPAGRGCFGMGIAA